MNRLRDGNEGGDDGCRENRECRCMVVTCDVVYEKSYFESHMHDFLVLLSWFLGVYLEYEYLVM